LTETEQKRNGSFKALIDLCRPFTMLAPAVGVYAGAMMAAKGSWPNALCIIAAIVGGLMNAASNTINQVTDIDIDRINKPARPIPSGRLSAATAIWAGVILYAICLVVAYIIGPGFFTVILLGAIFSWAYSIPPVRTKNNPILANPTMAIPRGILLILAGYVAQLELAAGRGTFADGVALLWSDATPWATGVIMFLFLAGAASTKDFADIKGDKALGARSIPVVLGVRRAAWFMAPFFVVPFLLISVAVALGYLIPATLPLMVLAIYGVYIAWLMLRNPESLALEGNHPSWKHMYILMMVTQIGFGLAYLIGSGLPAA
jgi:4-hydroxybenzoate polyprenyltransferase